MSTRGEKIQGNVCSRGHSGMRYAKGGACVECQKITDTKRRAMQKAQQPPAGKPQ